MMMITPRFFSLLVTVLLVVVPNAWATNSGGPPSDGDLPFEVTEDRPRCRHYDPNKQALFGTTHNHTSRSFDAALRFVRPGPADSYRFMKKKGRAGVVVGTNAFGLPTRRYQIDRPLDWGMVTDHSEHFGEMGFCTGDNEHLPGYYSFECKIFRGFYFNPVTFPAPQALRTFSSAAFTTTTAPNLGPSSRNQRLPVCIGRDGETRPECLRSELRVWDEMRNAADEANDDSRRCEFSAFHAYEVTSTPSAVNYHRNVVFRNSKSIDRPITAIDMALVPNPDPLEVSPLYLTGGFPNARNLWLGLQEECVEGIPGCDALTIPHNSNLGGGLPVPTGNVPSIIPPLFADPEGLTPRQRARRAQLRARWEPLVEIFQAKGGSECRYDPRFAPRNPRRQWIAQTGLNRADRNSPGIPDEACAFEILDGRTVIEASGVASIDLPLFPPTFFDPRAYVRNILKDGLLFAEENLGANPFKLGMGSSSDNHNATGGWHPEDPYSNREKGQLSDPWNGHLGIEDAAMTRSDGTIQSNSGGHFVVWAEENSRDSVFNALKNKETYGTSGPRHIVRFFGGFDFPEELCHDDFVPYGYEKGVPMGGDLYGEDRPRRGSPTFLLDAHYDDYVGTPLQQIQIIKGWVEEDRLGNLRTREAVYTIAGDPDNGASVNDDCSLKPGRRGRNFKHLCRVWTDPDFDPDQRAFYYGRVLENPVCRVSTHICQEEYGINPLDEIEVCEEQRERFNPAIPNNPDSSSADFANSARCCARETGGDPFVQRTIQERSWTSPIWYTPGSRDEEFADLH